MRLRDAFDRFTTIQSILYALAVAGLLILSSISVFYALNLPSEIEFTDSSMSCRFYFTEPVLTEVGVEDKVFTQVIMENCFPQASVGDPALPVYAANLLLPDGGMIDSIHVSYQQSVLLDYDFTEKPVLPQQEFVPFSVTTEHLPFVVNETAYESDTPSFERLYENGEVGFCRGFAILSVYLFPVQYVPTQGSLYYFPEMTITVHFKESSDAPFSENTSLLRYNEYDKQLIESIVANPTLIETYEPSGGDGIIPLSDSGLCDPADNNGLGYDFVIITSASLEDTTGSAYNWSDLLEYRRTYNGLEATIVTVEEIDACTAYWNETSLFNDTPAHIRAFCTDAYLNWGTDYILLGGDWDNTPAHQIVPYRLFTDRYETYQYDTMACDLYYSHLDGDWWDETNSMWGGGKLSGVNDCYGELSVGRIAVSNASQVSNAVQKILWYDTNASGRWLASTSFWGGNLGWTATSKQYMEELRLGTDTYRTFTGFEEWNTVHINDTLDTSEQLYHEDLGDSYKTFFTQSIEQDNASIINHLDHSDWNTPFSLNTWSSLSNTKPFLGYTQGCLSGRYQSGQAGCEQLICQKPGSFAYALVLNTGYGYGSTSTTNGPGQYLECYFWDYFFTNQSQNMSRWNIGKAFLYSQDILGAIVDSQPSHAWCYNWYSSHFFGDPAQILRVHVENEPVSVSNEQPSDDATDVLINLLTLSITIEDPEGDLFNWSIHTTPDIGSNSSLNASNGTVSCPLTGLVYDMTYTWFVNVSDGNHWTNETYIFSTETDPQNNSPRFSVCSPANGTQGVLLNLSSLSLIIRDPEGDSFNWTIVTIPNIGASSGTGESNGTKQCNVSALETGTTYLWYVNATDSGSGNTSTTWYSFTTDHPPVLSGPSPTAEADNISIGTILLSLTLEDPEGDACNYSIQTNPDIGNNSGVSVFNGTISCVISGMNYSSTYLWYVNTTDGQGWTNETFSFTTEPNDPPVFSSVIPGNRSTAVSVDTTSLSVMIQDSQADLFNWSITTSPDIGTTSELNASNGTKSCTISGLAYSTTYYWYLSAKDIGSNVWSNASYWFTTQAAPSGGSWTPPQEPNVEVNHPPSPPTQPLGPSDVELGVTITYSSSAYDSDGDHVRLQPDWDDGSVSNWSRFVDSNTSVSFGHAWASFSTYQVRVRAQDENGATSNWSEPQTVTVSEATTIIEAPLITINVSENISANQTILFDASGDFDTEADIISYFWDFGDGTTGTGKTPAHFYAKPGEYQVTLLMVDSDGNRYTKTLVMTVSAASILVSEEHSSLVLYVALVCGMLLFGVCSLLVLRKKHKKIVPSVYPDKKSKGTAFERELLTEREVDARVDLLAYPTLSKRYSADSFPDALEGKVDTLLLSKRKEKNER